MDCHERDGLRLGHAEALLEWTKAGGLDPMKAGDVDVISAAERVAQAANELIDHRQQHGC
jgi:hypothetical protein